MASKKTADKAVKKESGKKAVKATKKSAKAGKAESALKKSRQCKNSARLGDAPPAPKNWGVMSKTKRKF